MEDRIAAIKKEDMAHLAEYRAHLRAHPKLTYLFLELTDRCNLRCIHCGSSCDPANGRMIDTELLIGTLRQIALDFEPRTVMMCLTGGEPLLHPDFYQIVSEIVRLGFPWGLTTNATLVDGRAAKAMKALGLSSVTVSLDGGEKEHEFLRGSKGCYRKTVEAIGLFGRSGIPVQVTTVVHKKNFVVLEALYEDLCALGIASWRLINLEPIGRAREQEALLLDKEEFTALLSYIREKRRDANTPMEVKFGCAHYLSLDYERTVRDYYFICGAGVYVGGILCNGDICSCLDIERRPELIEGNIAVDRFSQVWREGFGAYRADRSALCEECRVCPERLFCGGDAMHTWNFDENKPNFCFLREEDLYVQTK